MRWLRAVLLLSVALAPGRSGRSDSPERDALWLKQPPAKRVHVEPRFPDVATREGSEGSFTFVCTIDSEGRVQETEATGGDAVFEASARAALRQWVFEPAPTGPSRRRFPIQVLFRIPGKPIHRAPVVELVQQLGSDDARAAHEAFSELADRGASVLDDLIPQVSSANARQRDAALYLLALLGAAAKKAAPAVATALDDRLDHADGSEASDLGRLARTLLSIDRVAALAAAERVIERKDGVACSEFVAEMDRSSAAEVQSPEEARWKQVLLGALDIDGCRYAVLSHQPKLDPAEIDVLWPALRDNDRVTRRRALEVALEWCRDAAGPQRDRMAEALVEVLVTSMVDPDAEIRALAASAVPHLGSNGGRTLDRLASLLVDADRQVRRAAVRSIEGLRLAAQSAGPRIEAARRQFADDEEYARELGSALVAVEAGKSAARLEEEAHIREAVVRYRAAEEMGEGKGRCVLFLEIKGEDAAEALLERLTRDGIAVRKGSAARNGPHDGMHDGLILDVGYVRWIAGDLVEVNAMSYCGPLCADGGVYVVAKQRGRWTVLRYRRHWIS
jgi:TonB family protein